MSKKTKMVLTDRDVGEQGVLLLKKLYTYQAPVTTTVLFAQTGLHRAKIRRVMARLALFKLVDEVNRVGKPNTYFITKIGMEFVKQLPTHETTLSEAVVPPNDELVDHKPEPPSLVGWLRQKADELNAMADHLSHYE